jgi:hypothetical protein
MNKDLDESGPNVIEVLSLHLRGVTDKSGRTSSQDSRCVGRDLKRAPTECKSRTLPCSVVLYVTWRLGSL